MICSFNVYTVLVIGVIAFPCNLQYRYYSSQPIPIQYLLFERSPNFFLSFVILSLLTFTNYTKIFACQYLEVVSEFLFILEFRLIELYPNRFNKYSIYSDVESLCSWNIVPVVIVKFILQSMYLYFCRPYMLLPFFLYFYHANTGTIEESTCLAVHYPLFHLKEGDDRNNDSSIFITNKRSYITNFFIPRHFSPRMRLVVIIFHFVASVA